MEQKMLFVKNTDLLRDSLKYIKIKCSMDDAAGEGTRVYQRCMKIWAKCFSGGQLQILTGNFGRECIDTENKKYRLAGQKFTCHLLEQTEISAVTGGILYLFHAPEVDTGEMDPLDCFYAECWQIALLDAARLWLEQFLRRQLPAGSHLSGSFGPGFFGMEVEAVAAIVGALGGEQIGVSLLPDGMMEPAKSLAGLFLAATQPFRMPSGDCMACRGTSHCRMCRHYSDSLLY